MLQGTGQGELALMLTELGQSGLFHPHGCHPGLIVIFLKRLLQGRLGRGKMEKPRRFTAHHSAVEKWVKNHLPSSIQIRVPMWTLKTLKQLPLEAFKQNPEVEFILDFSPTQCSKVFCLWTRMSRLVVIATSQEEAYPLRICLIVLCKSWTPVFSHQLFTPEIKKCQGQKTLFSLIRQPCVCVKQKFTFICRTGKLRKWFEGGNNTSILDLLTCRSGINLYLDTGLFQSVDFCPARSHSNPRKLTVWLIRCEPLQSCVDAQVCRQVAQTLCCVCDWNNAWAVQQSASDAALPWL